VPILLAVLGGFLLGVAFAWLARAELGRVDGPVVATRPFNVVAGFAGLVYGPLVGYFVAFHGDWTYGYLVPWHRVPSAVDLALVILAGSSVLFGMVASAHAARARRLQGVGWLGAIPTLASLAIFAWGGGRMAVSATYAQFHGGFGVVPVGSSTLGRGVLAMALVLTAGVAWTVRGLAQGEREGDGRERGQRPLDL
jgi:hypothetical protein